MRKGNDEGNATFRTTSGKEVWLSRLSFRLTYEGALVGTPESNSFYMREDNGLVERVKKEFAYVQVIMVFDDGAPELPEFE